MSEIVFYNSDYFKKWKNSLLVSTLKDKSLYRIIMSKKFDKVVNIEKIEIGYRIRDIIIDEKNWLQSIFALKNLKIYFQIFPS